MAEAILDFLPIEFVFDEDFLDGNC